MQDGLAVTKSASNMVNVQTFVVGTRIMEAELCRREAQPMFGELVFTSARDQSRLYSAKLMLRQMLAT